MTLSELTDPTAVEAALDEFDRLGRDAFLQKYGFGRASGYFVERNGKRYDSKAIIGAAFGFQFPERGPLRRQDFSGGEATVRPKLEALGFSVVWDGDPADGNGISGSVSDDETPGPTPRDDVPARIPKIWIEKTRVQGYPYRLEGEFSLGHAIVTPTRSSAGADVYRFMRELRPGDVVLHLTDAEAFTGVSHVAREAEEIPWEDPEFADGRALVVKLRDHRVLHPALHRDVVFRAPYGDRLVSLAESGTSHLFYATKPELQLRGGAYLTPAPPELVAVLTDAYRDVAQQDLVPEDWAPHLPQQTTPVCWVEKSLVHGRPDRLAGEYAVGQALWSPKRAKGGADVYRFMREVEPGDVVLHLTDNEAFTGVSRVARGVEDFSGVPGTAWEGDDYLVRLRDFVALEPPLSREVFFAEPFRERLVRIAETGAKNLFFDRKPALHQGAYLTPAPPELVAVLNDAYRAQTGRDIIPSDWPVELEPVPSVERREPDLLPFIQEESAPYEVWPPYSLADCARDTGLPEDLLDQWVRAIRRKGQAILYGPPGTGKTFVAEHLAKHLLAGGRGVRDLVQFHPAYGYEDFVLGIRPVTNADGMLSYEPRDGRFVAFCDRARAREGTSVLIVDEINRANLSQVFGELMYLLEYRDAAVSLAEGRPFTVPANVVVLGTMNTADRSIALMDYALRRRFAFLRLDPSYELLAAFLEERGFEPDGLVKVLRGLNAAIGDPNYHLGVSFFLLDDLAAHLEDVWRMEVEPYLEEYFFDQPERAAPFAWAEVAGQILP